MNKFYISIVILAAISCITEAAWKKALSGVYQYPPKDGCQCEWSECKQSGPGPRLFHVRCKHGSASYECVYKANPHSCKAYNKNQLKYYESLARKSGENRANACDQNPLTSNKICTEIDFAQIVPKRPAGNKWCVDS